MYQYQFKTWEQALPIAYPIRYQVFVIEQNIPDNLEIDEYDSVAEHLVLFFNELPIGTARIFVDNTEKVDTLMIGRLAILAEYRGRGLGKKMITYLITYAEKKFCKKLTLHAQAQTVPFYVKLGFMADSKEFVYDGIIHRKCTKFLV